MQTIAEVQLMVVDALFFERLATELALDNLRLSMYVFCGLLDLPSSLLQSHNRESHAKVLPYHLLDSLLAVAS